MAGERAFLSDEDYREAGAEIVDHKGAMSSDIVRRYLPPHLPAAKKSATLLLYFFVAIAITITTLLVTATIPK